MKKRLAVIYGKPFFVCLVAFIAVLPIKVHAACPAGTTLEARDRFTRNINAPRAVRNQSIAEGPVSIELALNSSAMGDLDISPSADASNLFFTRDFSGRAWQLVTPRAANLQKSNLVISYRVEAANGDLNSISSIDRPSSVVELAVRPTNLRRIEQKNRVLFRGYLSLDGNYAGATIAGSHIGTIVVTIDCI